MWQYHRFSVRLFLWPIKLKQQSQESRISFRDRFPFRPCVVPSIDKRWNMALNVYAHTHSTCTQSTIPLAIQQFYGVCSRAMRWQTMTGTQTHFTILVGRLPVALRVCEGKLCSHNRWHMHKWWCDEAQDAHFVFFFFCFAKSVVGRSELFPIF